MNNLRLQFVLLSMLMLTACDKFLDEKSNKRLATPSTIEDFKALLNDWTYLNSNFSSLGEASSDNYYLTDEDFNGIYYESDKRLYTWQPDYVSRDQASAGDEWSHCYRGIYVCNSVLDGIEKNNLTGKEADETKGQALVFRAARYLDAVQIWAPAYNKATADTDLGMVLRLESDMNIKSVRSSVQETYNQILKDLNDAVRLLPLSTVAPTLPTKAAAYGLLARTYLILKDYSNALQCAEKALTYNAILVDFNDLDVNANFPIPAINQTSQEVIFLNRMFASELVNNLNIAKIPTTLFSLYHDEDLRKSMFFRKGSDGSYIFKGTHMGHRGLVTGIMTSELFLIVAECSARLDLLPDAEDALNKLMVNRWNSSSFSPFSFKDKNKALDIILEERRKELIFRGLRWSDLKRLNEDGANIQLTRKTNGNTFTLPPNDKRYAIAIPEEVIEISGIEQNPR